MSGLVRGLRKTFRAVGKVVRKVALPALAIGAVVATGGALLGAAPVLGAGGAGAAAAASAAGVSGAGAAGAGAAAGGSGLGGFFSGIFGGGASAAAAGAPLSAIPGLGGAAATATAAAAPTAAGGFLGALGRGIGTVANSPIGGALLMGAANGWSQGAAMKEQGEQAIAADARAENQAIAAERRAQASYDGAGAAMSWDEPAAMSRGLAPQGSPSANVSTSPAASRLDAARLRTARPGLAATGTSSPRWRWNPETRQMDYA